ncbi:MAG: hypothetical protein KAV82_11735 [Phycisphaerae bacterium]|nr:hypothetical protein [Phycisphaerae bacterium]
MSFNLYTPKTAAKPLAAGHATVTKSGMTRLSATDLKAVGIEKRATVLLDRKTLRLALRKPRDDDFAEPSLAVRWNKAGLGASIGLCGPLSQLGLKPAAYTGPREVAVKNPDGLLILCFLDGKALRKVHHA